MIHRLNFDFWEKGLELVSPAHFAYDILKKVFLMLYSLNWPNFIVCLHYLWDIGQYVFCNYFFPRLCSHKFRNWPQLSYQAIPYMAAEWKGPFRWNQKAFFPILKGFQLPEIVSYLRVSVKWLSFFVQKWINVFLSVNLRVANYSVVLKF